MGGRRNVAPHFFVTVLFKIVDALSRLVKSAEMMAVFVQLIYIDYFGDDLLLYKAAKLSI